jgi:hypothetical protein
MLTFRAMRDPYRHLLYDNVEDLWAATRRWLSDPRRRRRDTLGLGIDRSDSLLYEGITGHAQHLAPMFAHPDTNPNGNHLVLLTKSTNVDYLEGIPATNVAVSFSVNPEAIADLWEGKWPDTGERITPPISDRLKACLRAQLMGYETRLRIDPILYPPGWQAHYEAFFKEAAYLGLRPGTVTLGTYREKSAQLDAWRSRWKLPPMEWKADELEHDGTHRHVREAKRIEIYRTMAALSRKYLPESRVAVCKETHAVRKATGLCNADCNCLAPAEQAERIAERRSGLADGRNTWVERALGYELS